MRALVSRFMFGDVGHKSSGSFPDPEEEGGDGDGEGEGHGSSGPPDPVLLEAAQGDFAAEGPDLDPYGAIGGQGVDVTMTTGKDDGLANFHFTERITQSGVIRLWERNAILYKQAHLLASRSSVISSLIYRSLVLAGRLLSFFAAM